MRVGATFLRYGHVSTNKKLKLRRFELLHGKVIDVTRLIFAFYLVEDGSERRKDTAFV